MWLHLKFSVERYPFVQDNILCFNFFQCFSKRFARDYVNFMRRSPILPWLEARFQAHNWPLHPYEAWTWTRMERYAWMSSLKLRRAHGEIFANSWMMAVESIAHFLHMKTMVVSCGICQTSYVWLLVCYMATLREASCTSTIFKCCQTFRWVAQPPSNHWLQYMWANMGK